MLTNPWLSISRQSNKYVAESDAKLIAEYNRSAIGSNYLRLDVLPEPFIGSLVAPVVLLNLNPGFDEENVKEHQSSDFQGLIRRNYEQTVSEFPFYYLNPLIESTLGGEWWRGRLKWLVADCGKRLVAQKLLCIEFFPYHSASFPGRLRRRKLVPSQAFGVYIAQSAIKRNALIVIMRSRKLWEREIPELKTYSRKCVLRNPQNTTISPGNCSLYSEIVSTVRYGEV